MNKLQLWLGLIALSIGIVFLFNLGSLNIGKQVYSIVIEIVIVVLIIGGLITMYLAAQDQQLAATPKQKRSRST